MENTLYVEYDSTDAVATDFIQRITLEMERMGVFKIRNKSSQKEKPLVDKKRNPVLDKLLRDFENNFIEHPNNGTEGESSINFSVNKVLEVIKKANEYGKDSQIRNRLRNLAQKRLVKIEES